VPAPGIGDVLTVVVCALALMMPIVPSVALYLTQ